MTKLMSRVSEASDEDAMAWEEQMEAYVALRPLQTSIDTLSKELPELEKEAVKREQAAELATTEAEKVFPYSQYGFLLTDALFRHHQSWKVLSGSPKMRAS